MTKPKHPVTLAPYGYRCGECEQPIHSALVGDSVVWVHALQTTDRHPFTGLLPEETPTVFMNERGRWTWEYSPIAVGFVDLPTVLKAYTLLRSMVPGQAVIPVFTPNGRTWAQVRRLAKIGL